MTNIYKSLQLTKIPTISPYALSLLLAITAVAMMNDAQATQQYMDYYKAPACTACHTSGVFNSRTGKAGLAAYLGSSTPATCAAPRVLQNNNCTMPTNTTNDSERIFAYLEASYPEHFVAAGSISSNIDGYFYRYYPATKSYLATINRNVYYLGTASQNKMVSLGAMSDWLSAATGTRYGVNDDDGNDDEDNDGNDHNENKGRDHD